MGYAKKALDLAIRTDKVDEFVNQIEYFIESVKSELSDQQENGISMHIGDLLRVRHKGRQPNRYKSCGEPQKKKSFKYKHFLKNKYSLPPLPEIQNYDNFGLYYNVLMNLK
ncbi:hypothetical protein RhiirC2_722471 [Rhizophagus irregularis]|uniref:Uncharacterized protein n=1 Tax=Rhizophagus irregularis TaxID=588596 RepID=A0A2N1M148_9GLOM|nr:hypothetical protein RhiirC2_722471 [Rhizophagus irregularis]